MIAIKQITERSIWDGFIDQTQPNTFLQSWEWADVQKLDGENVYRLGFYDNNNLIGVVLLLGIKAKRGNFLFCPHGPLAKTEELSRQLLEPLITYSRELAEAEQAVALRVSPLLITSPENISLFEKYGFKPAPLHMHTELTWVRDISKSEEEILQDMRKTTRHAIKKAPQAGVTTEVLIDLSAVEAFYPLYETTKTRHGFVPYSKKFVTQQFETFLNSQHAFGVVAKHEGKIVAAGLFMQTGKTVFYHHGASIKLPSSIPASHLLQWTAIQEAKRRGAIRYNFWGIAPEDKPNHPFAGITVFKKGFGGEALDYLHAQDLPLSFKYWKLWIVETWRKWRRGF